MSSDVEPGVGSGNRGTASLASLPVSPEGDKQVTLVCGTEIGDIYSVGADFCFRMPDLRRLDEEVDELIRSTLCGTSEGPSEKKRDPGASVSAALPVNPVTAEVRCVTIKRSSVYWKVEKARNRRAESMNVTYAPQVTFISTPARCQAV